jgi:DNA-binding response OmpR family regulator
MVEMLTNWLKIYWYKGYHAFTGKQAQRIWLIEKPDLVIVDTTLEDVDALIMCQDLRNKHDALILALVREKDAENEIHCLQAGVGSRRYPPRQQK